MIFFPLISTKLQPILLYIDPGTGSMIFTVLLAVLSAAFYSLRLLFMKLRFRISGGKAHKNAELLDFVIFSDDKRYWNIFEPICKEMAKRGQKVVYFTSSEDDPALKNSNELLEAEFIGEGNRAFARLNFLRAKVLLSTTPGLDVYQWKRSRDVNYYLHIPHAPSEVVLYRMFGLDYYDGVLLSGKFQEEDIRKLEKLRNLPAKDLRIVGIPYMDEMKKRLAAATPLAAKARTILLAPSWGESAIFSVYGPKIIEDLLSTGWNIIVRPHPQSFIVEKELMAELMDRFPESKQLEWNRDRDNFEVLRRADLLISDFSGVVFEFALVYDKPVIYTDPNFNLSVYDAWWLKGDLWTKSALPRLGVQLTADNQDNLAELIDKVLAEPRFAAGADEVRRECWAYPGEGAKRSVDFILDKIAAFSVESNEVGK